MRPIISIPYTRGQLLINIYGKFSRPLFLADEIALILGRANIDKTIIAAEDEMSERNVVNGNVARVCVMLSEDGICRIEHDYPGERSRQFVMWAWLNVIGPLRQMVMKYDCVDRAAQLRLMELNNENIRLQIELEQALMCGKTVEYMTPCNNFNQLLANRELEVMYK